MCVSLLGDAIAAEAGGQVVRLPGLDENGYLVAEHHPQEHELGPAVGRDRGD